MREALTGCSHVAAPRTRKQGSLACWLTTSARSFSFSRGLANSVKDSTGKKLLFSVRDEFLQREAEHTRS